MIVTGLTTFTGSIDVDGHTDLDNVSIAGVTTISSTLNVSGNTNLSSELRANANIRMTNAGPKITFVDSDNNPDYEVGNADGVFRIRDATSGVNRLTISTGGLIGVNNSSPQSQYFNNLVVGNNDSGDKGITIRSS